MDLGKLVKKLRNELLRNPKKSAVLGLICLVALYFWFPLIRGWLPGAAAKKPGKGAGSKQVAAAPAAAPASAPQAATAETSRSAARSELAYRWDKLLKLRKLDPLASPRELGSEVRNPFQASDELKRALAAVEEEETVENNTAPAAMPIVDLTPQQLGLVLKGTVVGPRLRAAQINGLTYQEGSVIATGGKSEAEGTAKGEAAANLVKFTLASVHRDHVVLTREDKSYTLEFPRGGLPAGDRIVLNPPAGEP